MDFKDNLKYFRRKAGLTQTDLAEQLHLTLSAVSNYENGLRRPSFEVLCNISDILGVSTDILIGHGEQLIVSVEPIEVDIKTLEIVQSLASNEDLLTILDQVPYYERCKHCVTLQFLCGVISKILS